MAGLIKSFPMSGSVFMPVPCIVNAGSSAIVPLSYRVNGNAQAVNVLTNDPLNPNSQWDPVMAVRINPPSGLAPEVTFNDSCNAFAWWLLDSRPEGATATTVPTIEYQVRTSFGDVPEVLFQGTLNISSFGDQGKILEVVGYSFNQVEFWARVTTGSAKVKLVLGAILMRFGGSAPSITKGTITK